MILRQVIIWLVSGWRDLPESGAEILATAVHQCLSHESPNVRAEALRTLDGCPEMADPVVLLDLAENHREFFDYS